jgi:hypothetical protein
MTTTLVTSVSPGQVCFEKRPGPGNSDAASTENVISNDLTHARSEGHHRLAMRDIK